MSIMEKFLDIMKLNDDENYDDDFYDDDDYEEPQVKKRIASRDDEEEDSKPAFKPKAVKSQTTSKVTPMRPSRRQVNGMEVCVIKPTTVEDSREITETLLSGRAVILNLEGLDVEIAQRIIDFTSGSCFAISGNLQKVSNYIFIITPNNVEISGDFQDLLTGAFNVPGVSTDI